MWNASLAFRVLTLNLSKAHLYILNFDKPTKMLTKGKTLKYIEFIILLRISNGSVNMNSFWLERIEIKVLLLDFQLKIQIENTTSFSSFRHFQKWVLSE